MKEELKVLHIHKALFLPRWLLASWLTGQPLTVKNRKHSYAISSSLQTSCVLCILYSQVLKYYVQSHAFPSVKVSSFLILDLLQCYKKVPSPSEISCFSNKAAIDPWFDFTWNISPKLNFTHFKWLILFVLKVKVLNSTNSTESKWM